MVLWQDEATAPTDRERPYVTQRGQDPLFRSDPTSLLPGPEKFTAAKTQDFGLTLADLPGVKVDVAGHDVHELVDEDGISDPGRRLWYADIEIDPGSAYTPFIRMALARYQPNSVSNGKTDVKLSPVVLLDFIQLLPDRVATVVKSTSSNEVTVSVTGRSYRDSSYGPGPSFMTVAIDRRMEEAGSGAENIGWEDSIREIRLDEFPSTARDGITTWTGTISGPPGGLTGSSNRLVIREYEVLGSEDDGGSRMVYMDTVLL